MKKCLFVIIALLFLFSVNYAQKIRTTTSETKNIKRCGTNEYMEYMKMLDTTLEKRLQTIEEFVQQWVAEHPTGSDEKAVITVPVVVHVIYANSTQNISDARVQEQITILNRDYSGQNPHSMYGFSSSLKTNTELQFCLAKRTPTGEYTNGINRKQTTVSQFQFGNNMKHVSTGGADQWDPHKYMNVWVCNLGGGLCGFAEFPTSNLSSNYGVVIDYRYFGITGAQYPYNGGGTTTHEIGHCFSLYHIWGDDNGACTGTDYCADTPNQASENFGTPTYPKTDACTQSSPGVMFMNFMDYVDDIAYANFTPNQKSRIQACFATGGPLVSLKTSNACTSSDIKENNISDILKIFPNPSNGLFYLNFNLAYTDNAEITVCNMLGDIITKIKKQKTSSDYILINITNQPEGMYYVKIQTATQTITRKILFFK